MKQRKTKPLHIKLHPDDPCPACNSGRPFRQCCVSSVGTLQIKSPLLMPDQPPSGLKCDGCYLSFTNDCSEKLTGEHYMSKVVLEQLGDFNISGAPWLKPGQTQTVGINSMTANILCARHNSQLSELDATAGTFFKMLDDIWIDMGRRSLSRRPTVKYISGETFERWMLKVFCGAFFSKIASNNRQRIINTHVMDDGALFAALLANQWQAGCGLYIQPGGRILPENKVNMAPLSVKDSNLVVGIQMNFRGLNVCSIFDTRYLSLDILTQQGWMHRVSRLRFDVQQRSHILVLTWPPGTPDLTIRSYAAPLSG